MFIKNFWARLEIGNKIILGLVVISGSVDLVLPVPVVGKVELDYFIVFGKSCFPTISV